jgi:hypothetical protein
MLHFFGNNQPWDARVTTIELQIPDALAEEARKAGLLVPEQIERILRDQLRQESIARLREARQTLTQAPVTEMTPEEIQAEIQAYRQDRRLASGS